jgi:hypothetical protein
VCAAAHRHRARPEAPAGPTRPAQERGRLPVTNAPNTTVLGFTPGSFGWMLLAGTA